MGIVKETSRKPSYHKDIGYGAIAEEDFSIYIKNRNIKCFDVRDERDYQNNDIDYILTKNSGIEVLPSINEVLNNDNFIKIEVKLDSRGLETGNLPYEVISHSSSGWCITTKCNWVYLALTERDSEVIKRRAWINMEKWHNFCAKRDIPKRINYIQSENGIVDLLCGMDDMEKNDVLKWINN